MILLYLFLAFSLPCIGMTAVFLVYVFLVYVCLLWYFSGRFPNPPAVKPTEKGLSATDLEKMDSKVVDEEDEVKGEECSICLDDLEVGQVVRWLPDYRHGFHVKCADAWLSKHPVCPVYRAKLEIFVTVSSPKSPSLPVSVSVSRFWR